MKRFIFVGVCIFLFSTIAQAETRYINDNMKITMRSGPATDRKIINLLSVGQKVDALKIKGDWTLVRLSSGKEGWVISRFLTDKAPKSIELKTLRQKHNELIAQAASLREENKFLKAKNKRLPKNKYYDILWRNPRRTRFLIIGISNYRDPSIPNVTYASSDANNLVSFAKSAGIPAENIKLIVNNQGTRNEITDAMMKLKLATTEESESAIFYFSGHGAPIVQEGAIVDAALVPYDARENSLEYTGIKISMLREMFGNVRGNWVIVLDSCFSGKEGRGLMAKDIKGIAVVPKNFNVVPKTEKNSCWITATSGSNFANDFLKQNSGLFTHFFLKALKGEKGVDVNEDGLISTREVFNWTKKEVQAVSAKSIGRLQVPELIGREDIILTVPR